MRRIDPWNRIELIGLPPSDRRIELPRLEFSDCRTLAWWDRPRATGTITRYMDIVKAVMNHMDMNVPWLPERYRVASEWCHSVARKANIELSQVDLSRNRYHGRYEDMRVYVEDMVDARMVEDILLWILDGLHAYLFVPYESRELGVVTRDVPRCPACERELKLMWVPYYTRNRIAFSLIWGCENPNWSEDCKEITQARWFGTIPAPLVAGTPITFMRQWELHGTPIPPEFALSACGSACTPNSVPGDQSEEIAGNDIMKIVCVRDSVKSTWTPEEEQCILETYAKTGPMGYFRRFRTVPRTLNSICIKAHYLGVTRKQRRRESDEGTIDMHCGE